MKLASRQQGSELSLEQKRKILALLNDFLYTGQDGLGTTEALDQEFPYFSEYHKFWKENHRSILNPTIDEKQCVVAADVLHDILIKYGRKPFYELYDTHGLKPKEICLIRYFSANQDFRGSREFEELVEKYEKDPSIFDIRRINADPAGFLKKIGITSLSQNDKREKYAKVAAQLLIGNNIEPYGLLGLCDNDVIKVRELMMSNRGSGFGKKKTDMFLRDMVVLNVWSNPKNFDKIDVASDINTIKVALRSGILKTEIPVLSSFLDVFCYQYGLMDEMNALAWRRVWEIWKAKYPKESVEGPCLMDYLIYRVIGKEFCKESLLTFECESKEHRFKWHSARNRSCQMCARRQIKRSAEVIQRVLPCTDDNGYLFITNSDFVSGKDPILPGIRECPFVGVCHPKDPKFKKFNPPKSISILGQTGWESARTKQGEGGGGLMS